LYSPRKISDVIALEEFKFKEPRHSKKWYEIQRLVKFGSEHTKKKFRRKLIKLGYAICPDCNGEGVVKKKIYPRLKGIRTRKHTCIRCRSTGIVDWLDRITGRSFV